MPEPPVRIFVTNVSLVVEYGWVCLGLCRKARPKRSVCPLLKEDGRVAPRHARLVDAHSVLDPASERNVPACVTENLLRDGQDASVLAGGLDHHDPRDY